MTEHSSIQNTVRKIKTIDEEDNIYIVEELDEQEIQNPLEFDHEQEEEEYCDYDMSMETSNVEGSDDETDRVFQSSTSNNRSMVIMRRTWDNAETKEMLNLFKENKRYIDRMMKMKNKYEFIAKKLTDRKPDQPVTASAIENKVKTLIRTYRSNRNRKYVPINDVDRDLEAIFGSARLLKQDQDDVQLKVFEANYKTSADFNTNDNYLENDSTITISDLPKPSAGPSKLNKIKILSKSETPRIRRQTQATQTDLGDNLLLQLIQIDKNQERRWQEEKVITSRIERAKADRFDRKEALLKELVTIFKSRTN